MINVVYRSQRLDYFAVSLIFLKLRALNGQGNRVNAESRGYVCGVDLNIVNLHAKLSYSGNKALQIFLVFKFEMNLEVIGLVLKTSFELGECSKAEHHGNEADHRNRVESRAYQKSYKANRPKSCRRCQSLYLIFRAEKDRI